VISLPSANVHLLTTVTGVKTKTAEASELYLPKQVLTVMQAQTGVQAWTGVPG